MENVTCYLCKEEMKCTMQKEHQKRCQKARVKCSGEECKYQTSRDKLVEHEDACEKIKEQCEQCTDNVPRYLQPSHDCVKALLERFRSKGKELNEYSTKVDNLALEIHKQ